MIASIYKVIMCKSLFAKKNKKIKKYIHKKGYSFCIIPQLLKIDPGPHNLEKLVKLLIDCTWTAEPSMGTCPYYVAGRGEGRPIGKWDDSPCP